MKFHDADEGLDGLVAAIDHTQTMVRDPDGTIRFWTHGAQALYGFSPEEAMGRISHELLRTEFPRPLAEIEEEFRTQGKWRGELRHRARDGSVVWVATHWTTHSRSSGGHSSVVEVNNDITALKAAEEALRGSEETANALLENASQGIVTFGAHGVIRRANLMLKRSFGYRRGELIGEPIDVLFAQPFLERHAPGSLPAGQREELSGRRKDGSELPVEISLSYLTVRGEALTMAFVSDITARKQADAEREALLRSLKNTLAEKTVLLQEIHHRVKNNLAVVAALLDLQCDSLSDERAIAALTESRRRIYSISLIHRHLYSGNYADRLDFADFTQDLIRELVSTMALDPLCVHVALEAEPLELDVDKAIPCGLILNELITNSLKHAFPDRGSGEIRVRLTQLAGGQVALSCEDNGIGLPSDFDLARSGTLGHRIMSILTKQIGGRLKVCPMAEGTRFELTFPTET